MSGGQAGAVNGALTVMVGGDQAPFDKAQPVAANYARMMTLIGPSGSGQLTKMVNQAIVAITVQGVSEGLAFAQKAGLDIPAGAIVGVPLAVGIAAALYLRRGRRAPRLVTEPPTAR